MNEQRKKSHCFAFNSLSTVIGFSTLSIGGLSEDILVARYLPVLMSFAGSPVLGYGASSRRSV